MKDTRQAKSSTQVKKALALSLLSLSISSAWANTSVDKQPTARESFERGSIQKEIINIAALADISAADISRNGELGLQAFLEQVMLRNERIQSQKMEWKISEYSISRANAKFEPILNSSIGRSYDYTRTTIERSVAIGDESEYESKNTTASISIDKVIETGATISLFGNAEQQNNSLQDQDERGEEFVTYAGVSITQPLWRDAWSEASTATVRISENDSKRAEQSFRKITMEELANATNAYWALYQAQKKYKIRDNSVRISNELLEDQKQRKQFGKATQSDVLDAQTGLSERLNLRSVAEQELTQTETEVRQIINLPPHSSIPIRARDTLEVTEVAFPSINDESLLESHPEYQEALFQVRSEDLREYFAFNQSLPQLDLIAAYGVNGLQNNTARSFETAFSDSYDSWSIGVQLNVPIGGNLKAESELSAAKIRKQQALLDLRTIERKIANSIDAYIVQAKRALDQVTFAKNAVSTSNQLLTIEMEKRKAGRQDIRSILERESNHNQAKEALLAAEVRYQRAVVSLKLASGTLLEMYGLEASYSRGQTL